MPVDLDEEEVPQCTHRGGIVGCHVLRLKGAGCTCTGGAREGIGSRGISNLTNEREPGGGQPKGARKRANSDKSKGDIVERIVARLYRDPDVNVERDAKLPARGSGGKRKRQIDVLITRTVAGLPIRIAIECKNYAKSVDVKTVDAFLSALQDVGIPPQLGIMVSASGYTEGAIERAQKEDLQLQVLDGLTPDRIASRVAEALQLVVYIELHVLEILAHSRVFFDAEGKTRGCIEDLIWQEWLSGELSSTLGQHELELQIPDEWAYDPDGREIEPRSATAKVSIVGYVLSVPGRAETHTLTTVAVKPEHRFKLQMRAYFEEPEGPRPVRIVRTEAELEALMSGPPAVKAQVGRYLMPRIRTFITDSLDETVTAYCYWPLSERVASILKDRAQAALAGQTVAFPALTFEYLEGTDLKAAFERSIEGYPGMRVS